MSDLRNFEGKLPKAVREFLEDNRILAATVYRSDADAPTAIVSAALRERAGSKAADAVADLMAEVLLRGETHNDITDAEGLPIVDAVLSTVLGRPVRYAKEDGCFVADPAVDRIVLVKVNPEVDDEGRQYRRIDPGDTIAILEEAGKEDSE